MSDWFPNTYHIISSGFSQDHIPTPILVFSTFYDQFSCVSPLLSTLCPGLGVLYEPGMTYTSPTQCFVLAISFPGAPSTSSLPIEILQLRISLTNFTLTSFLKFFLTISAQIILLFYSASLVHSVVYCLSK